LVLEKIAALVLTFNRKKLVTRTINALARQSFPPEKIFVVNNASTDGTERVLAEYCKQHPGVPVEIVTLKENLGASGGFAQGLEHIVKNCDAGWIYMMDDDAVPEKRALEKFRRFYSTLSPRRRLKTGIRSPSRTCTAVSRCGRPSKDTSSSGK
jgi:rhamnopyranosyl-N-acetylglucosaminyl-diphospho-decaprenol beta-1,3/1,4-galactofuranosyltransferase